MRRTGAPLVLAAMTAGCSSSSAGAPAAGDASVSDAGAGPAIDAAISIPPPIDDADAPPSEAGPGGPWVAFVSSRGGGFDLYLIHPDGTGLRPLVQDPANDLTPAWSPDGRRVAFASNRSGAYQIYEVDVASGVVTPIPTGRATAIAPSYAPDGGVLVFGGDGPDGGLVYAVPAGGGASTPVTSGAARDSSPVFAPDGTVYFASDRSGAFEVWSVKPDGTALAKVTSGAQILGGPAVAPGGATLAFAQPVAGAGAGASTQVVLYTVATGARAVLSAHGDSEPAFAPNGARVAMTTTRYAANNADVVLVDPDGGSPFRLTDDPAIDGQPAFQP